MATGNHTTCSKNQDQEYIEQLARLEHNFRMLTLEEQERCVKWLNWQRLPIQSQSNKTFQLDA